MVAFRYLAVAWVLLSVGIVAPRARGGDAAADRTVETTILVPKIVMQKRTVCVIECRPEIRQYTVTVFKLVPETRIVEQRRCIQVAETRWRDKCYTVNKPVFEDVEECYLKNVPYKVTKQGTKTVWKDVQVTETRIVCEDRGHWEERPCGCCPRCGHKKKCGCETACTRKVWVPKIVRREEQVTVTKRQAHQVPYSYVTTCYRQEERTRTKKCFVCYRPETITKRVKYTVYHPKTIIKKVPVTTYKCVEVEEVRRRTVMVPHEVEKEILVPVCIWVPQKVVFDLPTADECIRRCGRWLRRCTG